MYNTLPQFLSNACAEPGNFTELVQARLPENSLDKVFFFFSFSPQLILQFTEGVHWCYYRENYTFPRIQRGSNIYRGGGGGGGPNANFYRKLETHIIVIFQGGS